MTQQAGVSSAIVLRNANIHSMADSGAFVGSVIVREGKIVDVIRGEDAELASELVRDARVYDLRGFTLTPGLIDCRSALWLEGGAIGESSSTAALNIVDGIDLYQEDWQEVARQGITAVGLGPSGGLGGYAAAFHVLPNQRLEQLLIKDEIAVMATIGLDSTSSMARYQEFNRLKSAIKKIIDGDAAEKAKEEEKTEEQGEEKQGEGEATQEQAPGQQPAAQTGNRITPPNRTDELLKRVVKGQVPLRVRVRHSDAIGWVLSMAEEFGIRVILEEIPQATRWSNKIVDLNFPLVVGPFAALSQTVTDLHKDFSQAWVADYANAGGVIALATFTSQPRGSRLLRLNAASYLAAVPITREHALRAVTINAAKVLGVAELLGSIEPGKIASMAVFAGDPLDPATPVKLVISNGHVVFESAGDVDVAAVVPSQIPHVEVTQLATLPSQYLLRSNHLLQDGKFVSAYMLVKDGIVEAVGDIDDPGELTMIDLGDLVITPGLVAANSHLGHQSLLGGHPESDATLFRSVDLFDSQQKLVKTMSTGGFLHIGFSPTDASTSAGSVGQIRLGPSPKIIDAHIASKFVLTQSARSLERYPASLIGQVEMLNQLLQSQIPTSRMYVSAAMARAYASQTLQLMDRVKQGDAQVLFVAGSPLELQMALHLTSLHQLRGSLLVDSITADLVNEVVDSKLGLIIASFRGVEFDRYLEDLAKYIQADVRIGFSGEDPQEVRSTAAMLASIGVSRESLLRGLTVDGALVSGMSEKTGELTTGVSADFVIWDGSPLDLSSRPLAVFVDGRLVR
ncbi:MAG TPA: amidohydrolase family protein [Pirellulaceae bacterium]|nr:amidohydrolase family protein [Pirellulaceae bacterium]HMO92315.1 amidohydrolase family protein [Pirellulaceae bacterium]HMP69239.1 amidohydrolase family protein [Pirellulaceae bacterium]